MTSLKVKPKYTHNCTDCVFLGKTVSMPYNRCRKKYDLYYCPSDIGSCIARDVDRGPEYLSAPYSVLKNSENPHDYPLMIAKRIAEKMGLTELSSIKFITE